MFERVTGNTGIRRMEGRDVPQAAKLEQTCFSVPWPAVLLEDCLGSRFDKVWVLETEETADSGRLGETGETEPGLRIAGYCNFRMIAGEGELMRIAVAPEYRGRGYARSLMEILVDDARREQAEAITLEVRASNFSAINLYRSYGFEIEAIRRGYYTSPSEDALIMWRRRI